jgi:hypothetical protein
MLEKRERKKQLGIKKKKKKKKMTLQNKKKTLSSIAE